MCSFSVSAGIISARVPYLQWYVIEGVFDIPSTHLLRGERRSSTSEATGSGLEFHSAQTCPCGATLLRCVSFVALQSHNDLRGQSTKA